MIGLANQVISIFENNSDVKKLVGFLESHLITLLSFEEDKQRVCIGERRLIATLVEHFKDDKDFMHEDVIHLYLPSVLETVAKKLSNEKLATLVETNEDICEHLKPKLKTSSHITIHKKSRVFVLNVVNKSK